MVDGHGRAGAKIETVGAAEQRWDYAYDKDGRLTETQLNGQVMEQYVYDHEGRRAAFKCRTTGGESVEYVYDAKDRLLSLDDVQFAYDSDGRMIGKTERGQTTRYAYDDSGFLAYVEFPGGQRLTYERDACGLVRRTLLNGQPQEEFVWRDGLRLESWCDIAERRTLEFHFEEDRRVPHAVTVYEGGYTYHCALGADQVGTIKTVADDTGYLIKDFQYGSFGNLLEDSNSRFYLPLGFAGGILDRHTGLIRFGWRYYMPDAGRFTAPDPARWQGGDPDLYDYCVDDPVSLIDPLGLWLVQAGGTLVGGGINAYKYYDDWKANKISTGKYAGLIGLGALTGGLSTVGGGGILAGGFKGGAMAAANEAGSQAITKGKIDDYGKVGFSAATGIAAGAAGSAATKTGKMIIKYDGKGADIVVKDYGELGGGIGNTVGAIAPEVYDKHKKGSSGSSVLLTK